MRRDANGGKAGAGGFDARDEREQIVDGVGCPGVGVGARVAGDFRPGAEVKREQLAPRVEGLEVVVGHAGVFESAGEVEAEVIRGAEDAVGGGSRLDGEDLAQDFLPVFLGNDVVEDGEDIGLLVEVFEFRIVGDEAACGAPAFALKAGADVGGTFLVAGGDVRIAEVLFRDRRRQ